MQPLDRVADHRREVHRQVHPLQNAVAAAGRVSRRRTAVSKVIRPDRFAHRRSTYSPGPGELPMRNRSRVSLSCLTVAAIGLRAAASAAVRFETEGVKKDWD